MPSFCVADSLFFTAKIEPVELEVKADWRKTYAPHKIRQFNGEFPSCVAENSQSLQMLEWVCCAERGRSVQCQRI